MVLNKSHKMRTLTLAIAPKFLKLPKQPKVQKKGPLIKNGLNTGRRMKQTYINYTKTSILQIMKTKSPI
jgi:hypothetical protein